MTKMGKKNGRLLFTLLVVALSLLALAAFVQNQASAAEVSQAPAATSTVPKVSATPIGADEVLAMHISLGAQPLVSLLANGQMVFAPGYRPTPAAVAFWAAVADINPYTQMYDTFLAENLRLRRELEAAQAEIKGKGKKSKK